MLAMNTITATAHWSWSISNLIPSQTVLSEYAPCRYIFIIG